MSISRFSGVLQLTDLDDFIAPSQAICFIIIIIGRCYNEIGVRERLEHVTAEGMSSGRLFQATGPATQLPSCNLVGTIELG